MKTSKQYVQDRIKNNDHVYGFDYEKLQWASDSINNTISEYMSKRMCEIKRQKIDTIVSPIVITSYKEDDFDYFIIDTCICDGTLFFAYNLVDKILQKVFGLNTAFVPKVDEFFKKNNCNSIDLKKYKIHYQLGEPVFAIQNVKSPDPTKPYMQDKFYVFVPAKFDIKERG